MSAVRIIKKYPNRRLYDCVQSRHITLEELYLMVVQGMQFQIVETSSGKNITGNVLFQIVADQERTTESLLSADFLLQLIRFYGSSTSGTVRSSLEESLRLVVGAHFAQSRG